MSQSQLHDLAELLRGASTFWLAFVVLMVSLVFRHQIRSVVERLISLSWKTPQRHVVVRLKDKRSCRSAGSAVSAGASARATLWTRWTRKIQPGSNALQHDDNSRIEENAPAFGSSGCSYAIGEERVHAELVCTAMLIWYEMYAVLTQLGVLSPDRQKFDVRLATLVLVERGLVPATFRSMLDKFARVLKSLDAGGSRLKPGVAEAALVWGQDLLRMLMDVPIPSTAEIIAHFRRSEIAQGGASR